MKLQFVMCKKCGHSWSPRVKKPVRCPNRSCQANNWDTYEKKEVESIESR